MHHVSLGCFCAKTGLSTAEVQDLEERGLIQSTTKGTSRFYSFRETYRAKAIIYFMRTQGLNPEEAAARIDEQTMAANQK
jgi:DNA-binding transcriptional MerR regulator